MGVRYFDVLSESPGEVNDWHDGFIASQFVPFVSLNGKLEDLATQWACVPRNVIAPPLENKRSKHMTLA